VRVAKPPPRPPHDSPTFLPLRLRPGMLLDGYRLGQKLGRGEEGTVYRAVERTTGISFALKLLHERGREAQQLAWRTAKVFHRLRGTGAVATYHRCGRVGDAVFLLFDQLEGVPLAPLLRRRRWSRSWVAEDACLILYSLARKLAAVHRCGLTINDFSHGNNIVLVGGQEPVFCDLEVGDPAYPNRDYGLDLELFAELALDLANIKPLEPMLQHAHWLSLTHLERRPTRTRMTKLATAIGRLKL
jgi:serine/threonine protein kinase